MTEPIYQFKFDKIIRYEHFSIELITGEKISIVDKSKTHIKKGEKAATILKVNQVITNQRISTKI